MMNARTISYNEAKQLTLDRLYTQINRMPRSEREMPRIVINFNTYSYLDLIAEVQRNSTVGRQYVYDTANNLNYVIA